MSDIEKPSVDHVNEVETKRHGGSLSNSSEEDILSEFSPEETQKIIHRVDRRLVTTVGLMYCVSLMDRTNLSAAAIAG
jgi:hypothetical protein